MNRERVVKSVKTAWNSITTFIVENYSIDRGRIIPYTVVGLWGAGLCGVYSPYFSNNLLTGNLSLDFLFCATVGGVACARGLSFLYGLEKYADRL